jgi:hypothetical protein
MWVHRLGTCFISGSTIGGGGSFGNGQDGRQACKANKQNKQTNKKASNILVTNNVLPLCCKFSYLKIATKKN